MCVKHLLLRELSALKEEDGYNMEWDVELGARTEHRHELVQGVKNAAVFMDVTTVDETSLVYVLG